MSSLFIYITILNPTGLLMRVTADHVISLTPGENNRREVGNVAQSAWALFSRTPVFQFGE